MLLRYVPPKVENGVIPTNSYGNYELWSPAHLPEGCVHMPYAGIAGTAKQLGIQFAKAMTGFEYKRSGAHPIFEGKSICDILIVGWPIRF